MSKSKESDNTMLWLLGLGALYLFMNRDKGQNQVAEQSGYQNPIYDFGVFGNVGNNQPDRVVPTPNKVCNLIDGDNSKKVYTPRINAAMVYSKDADGDYPVYVFNGTTEASVNSADREIQQVLGRKGTDWNLTDTFVGPGTCEWINFATGTTIFNGDSRTRRLNTVDGDIMKAVHDSNCTKIGYIYAVSTSWWLRMIDANGSDTQRNALIKMKSLRRS